MSKQSFDRKIEEIAALKAAPDDTALPQLRKAMRDRNNYAVAKAAAIAGERQFHALEPELLDAFERFLRNAAKTDPQCWAKNAIAKALKELACADAAVFFRGASHVQMEAVWGGSVDTAATLRGTCALALIGTTAATFEILTCLTDLLGDPESTVRIDAARAIAQLSAREGMLPLRLKALIGDAEPEVVGHCLAGLLTIAPDESLSFVARFLQNKDREVRLEAAGVLSESREPRALDLLKEFWESQTDPEIKRTLLTFLSGSPLPEAADFLLSIVENSSGQMAAEARAALSKSRFRDRLFLIRGDDG